MSKNTPNVRVDPEPSPSTSREALGAEISLAMSEAENRKNNFVERALHYPLPRPLKKDEEYKAKNRYIDFNVEQTHFPEGEEEPSEPHGPLRVVFDRANPENTREKSDSEDEMGGAAAAKENIPYKENLMANLSNDPQTLLLLHAMSDLRSNIVVTLGDARLPDGEAKRRVEEYNKYLDRKKRNLIDLP